MNQLRSLLIPTHIVRSVADIDVAAFCRQNPNIRGIGYDLDGTLADYEGSIPPENAEIVGAFGERSFWQGIMSNADHLERSERVFRETQALHEASRAEVDVITSRLVDKHKKPHPAMFSWAVSRSLLPPRRLCYIDDQLLKGIVGANYAAFGAVILVARYGKGDDPRVERYQRPIEEWLRPKLGLPRSFDDFPTSLQPVGSA